jgi:GH15 family glucan-1,4-alpha-glucosidase
MKLNGWKEWGFLTWVLAMLVGPGAHADDRATARRIAAAGLRQNIAQVGGKSLFVAGGHQFHDLWVRDFAMSVGGLLAISREDVVRDSLDLILSLQREDGLLPRVIDNQDITGRTILGSALGLVQDFAEPLKGWYETENKVVVIDGNALVPWAASRYFEATRDLDSVRRWYPAIEKSLAMLEASFGADGLITRQPPYSDWEDSVARSGRVALTNEFYLLALRGTAELAAALGLRDQAADVRARELKASAAFLKTFWDASNHRIINYVGDDHWTADANFMAVAQGLVPSDMAQDILSHWPKDLWNPLPRTTWPDYPDSLKDQVVKLVGIADYHDRLYWLWIGALAALAERETGHIDRSVPLLETMAARVAADGAVYEVYELGDDGVSLEHVDRMLYTAEQPFSWSAAMLLEAEAALNPAAVR